MKIGIMQPYFFPYFGYFSLIEATDFWVFLDEVQFIRHGWIERNRILNPNKDWQYIKVPLHKKSRQTKIKDMEIRINENWKAKLLSQILLYKRRAPFYNSVAGLIVNSLENDFSSITHQNAHIISQVCKYLEINIDYDIFSVNTKINYDNIHKAGDWAFEISKFYSAKEYINPIGGKEIFDTKRFKDEGIKLSFLENNNIQYKQINDKFIEDLSIIDVLMFNSVKTTKNLIKKYKISSN